MVKSILSLSIIAIMVSSCSTSNDVVGGIFQKRKYNKGVYWNRGAIKKTDKTEKGESDVAVAAKEEIRTLEKNSVQSIETSEKSLAVSTSSVVTTAEAQTSDAVVNNSGSSENTTVKEKTAANAVRQTAIREKKGKTIPQLLNKKQKSQGGADSDGMFILAVIFAILIPPLGVLIYTNIDWMKVLICLLLTILFFLPGMIYALLVVFDVI